MDLLSYLRILRRRWTLIAVVALVGVALGAGTALASSSTAPSGQFYKATNVLVLDTTNTSSSSSGSQPAVFGNLSQDAFLVTTGDVPNAVGKKLGQNGRLLAEQVLTTTDSSTNTIQITAIARDAGTSEQLANTFADQLIAGITQKEQQSYTAQRNRVVKRRDDLQAQVNSLNAQLAANPGNTVLAAQQAGVVDEYKLAFEAFQQLADQGDPSAPLSTLESAQSVPISAAEYDNRLSRGQLGQNQLSTDPNSTSTPAVITSSSSSTFQGPVSRGLLGGFLGLLGGIGLALVAERLDRRLRSRPEVEEVYGRPVLAQVPILTSAQQHDDEVVSHTLPLSRTAEAHRAVRSALIFQRVADGAPRRAGNGDGPAPAASKAASNIAAERPETDEPLVVLVTSATANEGKTTTIANLAAVFAETGASVLAVNCDFRRPSLHRYLGAPDEPRKVLETTIPGVTLVSGVLTDPAANPSQIIAAQRQVIATAKERFDIVLLDTAPLTTTNDAIEIMSSVDAVVLVARPDVTTSDAALRARELLERVDAPVVGVLLVADDSTPDDAYYYYSSRRIDADTTKQDVAPRDSVQWSNEHPPDGDIFPAEAPDGGGEKTSPAKPS